jgi:two-component system LytT family sensor kinase
MYIIKKIPQSQNLKTVRSHAGCWLIFMAYECFLYYYSIGHLPRIVPYFYYYSCNIAIFYCHVWILSNQVNKINRNYLKITFVIIIEITFFLWVKIIGDFLFTDFSKSSLTIYHAMRELAFLDLIRIIYFSAFATLYWTLININGYHKKASESEIIRLKSENAQAALEVKLSKAENAYLQQQISPHLLFNSLNFIHSSVYKISSKAAESVILLADIMRYTLEATDGDGKINLINEAQQIENLMTINQHRFDYKLNVRYTKEGDFNGYKIIPLVLMTLTENVFKHGDLKQHPAVIELSVSKIGKLRFYTYNQKLALPAYRRLQSTGIANIRTRLDFSYGSRFKLDIRQTDNSYECELILPL